MWIMMIKKLSTVVSPPKMSIHWSVPWPDDKHAELQKKTCASCGEEICGVAILEAGALKPWSKGGRKGKKIYCACGSSSGPVTADMATVAINKLGMPEHNWVGARAIQFEGERLRVFPNEFSEISNANMSVYTEDDSSHELVSAAVVGTTTNIVESTLDSDARFVMDAALCDGCNKHEALMVAMGMDITIEDATYPAVGWYKCREEYAELFCRSDEM